MFSTCGSFVIKEQFYFLSSMSMKICSEGAELLTLDEILAGLTFLVNLCQHQSYGSSLFKLQIQC